MSLDYGIQAPSDGFLEEKGAAGRLCYYSKTGGRRERAEKAAVTDTEIPNRPSFTGSSLEANFPT